MGSALPSGSFSNIRSSRTGCGRMMTVPELASECFSIMQKGYSNIAEHAEELPNHCRKNVEILTIWEFV